MNVDFTLIIQLVNFGIFSFVFKHFFLSYAVVAMRHSDDKMQELQSKVSNAHKAVSAENVLLQGVWQRLASFSRSNVPHLSEKYVRRMKIPFFDVQEKTLVVEETVQQVCKTIVDKLLQDEG